jgi:hypothetical protein
MYFVRLARWYWLLAPVERVPLATVLRVGSVGFLAIATLPFRMGEVVRPLLIRRGSRLTFWAASGTVGAERVIDALSISVLLLLSLKFSTPVEPLPDHLGTLPIPVSIVPRTALVAALTFAAACLVMGVFYWRRAWARRTTERIVGLVSPKLADFVASKIEQMAEGLGFLTERRYAAPFLAATLLYWLLNATTWWVLAWGCGLGSIGFFGATATMGVVALGILVPATPGFFGTFQFATFAGLAMFLSEREVMGRGSAYAFLGYVLPIGMTILMGIIGILAKPRALFALRADPLPATPENLAERGTSS